ncbi:hypothetical protein Tco_0371766 [Tanacetum coccineum]
MPERNEGEKETERDMIHLRRRGSKYRDARDLDEFPTMCKLIGAKPRGVRAVSEWRMGFEKGSGRRVMRAERGLVFLDATLSGSREVRYDELGRNRMDGRSGEVLKERRGTDISLSLDGVVSGAPRSDSFTIMMGGWCVIPLWIDMGSFDCGHGLRGQKDEYDIWAMEMEHYLEYIDNDVWKVIQNGNSKKRISTGKDGVIRILPPVTAIEIQAVEKERKAKNILLMAIPKEHMRRFHGMDDAKEI